MDESWEIYVRDKMHTHVSYTLRDCVRKRERERERERENYAYLYDCSSTVINIIPNVKAFHP